mmetsp:Transcript_6445/g.26503  ORF Transcript_6445/g.26503 Transcript_6445/m.26503 type:complete len:304 (+) Transcript_6445:1709-2620(+)
MRQGPASAATRDGLYRQHHIAALRPMPQRMVHQHQREHRLGNRRGADAHAGVVAAEGLDNHRLAGTVDAGLGAADRAGGLDRDLGHQVLPGRDAAEHAAGVVARKALGRQLIAMLAAFLRDRREARADLDALDRVDAHQRIGDVGIELVEQRRAQADRHAGGLHTDARTDRIAGLAQPVHIVLKFGNLAGVGGEERVLAHVLPAFEGDGDLAELRHAAAELGAISLLQPFAGHGPGAHHRRGQACGRTAAATRVAQAVFAPVGVVGMARAKGIEEVAVVLAALVGVLDQQADRRAGGQALVDT